MLSAVEPKVGVAKHLYRATNSSARDTTPATMQRESNARFLLAVRLGATTNSAFTFIFQRDFYGHDLYPVTVPRRQLQRLSSGRFFEYVTDTYLAQQPAEALRVTRATILLTLTHGL